MKLICEKCRKQMKHCLEVFMVGWGENPDNGKYMDRWVCPICFNSVLAEREKDKVK